MAQSTPHLHRWAAGDPAGETVLFLHALGASSEIWRQQVAALPDYRCIVVDLPGHGYSHKTAWESLRTTAELMQAIIAQQTEGSGRAHIVGLSLGAYVALTMTDLAADTLGRVILLGANVVPLPNERTVATVGYLMSPFLKQERYIRMNANGLYIPDDGYDDYALSIKQMSVRSYLRASSDAADFRANPTYSQAAVPTLVATGEDEHPLIQQSRELLVNRLPQATGHVVADVGHGWSGEKPEQFGRIASAWFSDEPLPEEPLTQDENEE